MGNKSVLWDEPPIDGVLGLPEPAYLERLADGSWAFTDNAGDRDGSFAYDHQDRISIDPLVYAGSLIEIFGINEIVDIISVAYGPLTTYRPGHFLDFTRAGSAFEINDYTLTPFVSYVPEDDDPDSPISLVRASSALEIEGAP